jgi:hypothetical protein
VRLEFAVLLDAREDAGVETHLVPQDVVRAVHDERAAVRLVRDLRYGQVLLVQQLAGFVVAQAPRTAQTAGQRFARESTASFCFCRDTSSGSAYFTFSSVRVLPDVRHRPDVLARHCKYVVVDGLARGNAASPKALSSWSGSFGLRSCRSRTLAGFFSFSGFIR